MTEFWPQRRAAERFGVGIKTAIEWVRRARETGETMRWLTCSKWSAAAVSPRGSHHAATPVAGSVRSDRA